MGLLENLIGTNPQFVVTDRTTGKEIPVLNAKELEKYAAERQGEDPNKPPPLGMRIFGTTNRG